MIELIFHIPNQPSIDHEDYYIIKIIVKESGMDEVLETLC